MKFSQLSLSTFLVSCLFLAQGVKSIEDISRNLSDAAYFFDETLEFTQQLMSMSNSASRPPVKPPTDPPKITDPPIATEAPTYVPTPASTATDPTYVPTPAVTVTQLPTFVPTPADPPTFVPTPGDTVTTDPPTPADTTDPPIKITDPPTFVPTPGDTVTTDPPTYVPTPDDTATEPPTFVPTPAITDPQTTPPTKACHDIGGFTFVFGSDSLQCDSIETPADVDKYCNLNRRFKGSPLLPVKQYCPEACGHDCAPTVSPTTAIPATDPPTVSMAPTPFICEALATKNYAEYEEKVKEIYRPVSGQNAFDGTDPDRMDALNFILDEGLCVDPPEMIQRYISALFYYSTIGEKWKESEEWVSPKHECDWNGIECNDDKIINRVNRDDNTLQGTIPFEICDLPLLERLDLDSNEIGGTIPKEMGKCSNLVSFDVDANNLVGPLPEELFDARKLVSIDLDSNNLTGTLSNKIGNLLDLQFLALHKNQFTGQVPARMHVLKNLARAYFDTNKLTGAVPRAICNNFASEKQGGSIVDLTTDCGGPGATVSCVCCTNCN
mmetsp:Transcript_32019/g.73658  ORF Transcript_32019/g.73658 Transcript_32019/m.73658 type:complete len:553 (-) Transcript_32019:144-1802(-)|eukprot:CAMPEP_0113312096 /NCGR_PEP_ID=MMETSP0010_2-20120614/9058_1 /TAXON_ID=216773 ORGANISM="Corethron hystrix, Strain 308" /NCGR_SAMPLE_ID=MMETSP0010_2 /ASSEMBLY_ACC=CAM_ASM_000155 /LENGTH=552 /DNA_ID=CAMNT_0000167843 /DNA_START=15 /DNA_END=1673 /DNA_ORIENTATION=- /assembly_acc=CAM_ASM_000155